MTLIPIQKYCDKLKVPYCNIFERVLVDGNALVVEAFLSRLPDSEFGLLIRSNGYKVFKSVAEKGRVDMIDMILARATEADRMAMLRIQNIFVFLGAASRGDCDVVRTLLNREPELIRSENYQGIIRAINGGNYPSSEDGHYPVVKAILDLASPTDRLPMIRANNYFAFTLIPERENFEIFTHLTHGTLPHS